MPIKKKVSKKLEQDFDDGDLDVSAADQFGDEEAVKPQRYEKPGRTSSSNRFSRPSSSSRASSRPVSSSRTSSRASSSGNSASKSEEKPVHESKGPKHGVDKRIPAELVKRVGNQKTGERITHPENLPVMKDQRVGVFVDVQNMYYSAKHLFNAKVNFKRLLENGVRGRKCIRAIAYTVKADIKEEANFFEALEKIGYEIKTKELQIFVDGSKKGDWDVGIAMDAMQLAPKLDVVVLVSGDGDFKDLVDHLRSTGCKVEVMSFRKTSSTKLIIAADTFTDLASRKYLIK